MTFFHAYFRLPGKTLDSTDLPIFIDHVVSKIQRDGPCSSFCVFCFLYHDLPPTDKSKVFIHQTSEPAAVNNPLHQRPNPNMEIARKLRSDRRNLIVKFTGNLLHRLMTNRLNLFYTSRSLSFSTSSVRRWNSSAKFKPKCINIF